MSRNGGYDRYRAALADENAWARARHPKYCKLANSPRLRRAVARKLRLDWSPEQIAGWLKRTHPEDGCNQVSHETIYRSLFVQTRGVLKKELLSHLRSKRSMRRSKPVDPNGDRRGRIKNIISIRQRPAAVEDRAVPGHWEGDLLSGPNNSYIAGHFINAIDPKRTLQFEQQPWPSCVGGHGVVPYEQNTQQSTDLGLSLSPSLCSQRRTDMHSSAFSRPIDDRILGKRWSIQPALS